LAFTIIFSTFLLLFINWHALLLCSHSHCTDGVELRNDVFSSPTTFDVLVFMYFAVFCLYWLWNFFSFFYTLRDAMEMRAFYRDDLQIQDDDLLSLEWHYILDSLVSLQVSGRKKLCIVKDLTALDITNRIMRKENYMIAMINLDIFQLGFSRGRGRHDDEGRQKPQAQPFTSMQGEKPKVLRERRPGPSQLPLTSPASSPKKQLRSPLLSTQHGVNTTGSAGATTSSYSTFSPIGSPTPTTYPSRQSSTSPSVTAHPSSPSSSSSSSSSSDSPFSSWWSWAVLGTTLEWNLRFCILNSLFDSHFNIPPSYLGARGIKALKMRFIIAGVANLILSPFILLFMIIFFFLRHAEELHSKKSVFGPRQWCLLAQWKIREFNELPHIFERRLSNSAEAAQKYLAQFPSTLRTIVAQCIAYIAGSIVAILLVLTVTDSDAITHRLWDRTLLWYLAIFSAILAVARSQIPDKSLYPSPALIMAEIVQHTHYYPQHWRGKAHTQAVHAEFGYMFPSRLSMFLFEMMSVILTPILLIFCLPQSAERIVHFVSTRTVHVQGVGHLCSYATFDLEKHGDPRVSHLQPLPASASAGREDKGYMPTPISGLQRQHSPSAQPPPFPLRPKDGKLEKSFLNFAVHHPHWKVEGEGGGATGGQRFLTSLAESMTASRTDSAFTPPTLSREPSGSNGHATGGPGSARKLRPSSSIRLAPTSPRQLPTTTLQIVRQDSLDSDLTDGTDGESEPDGDGNGNADVQTQDRHDPAVEDQTRAMDGKAATASELLSASDRHLIQSFADMIGLDPAASQAVHPSVLMRQSSVAGLTGSHAQGVGLHHRRVGGGFRGGMGMGHSVMRSHLGASLLPSASVAGSMLGRSMGMGMGMGIGGGIGGVAGSTLTSSALLQLDPQAVREQLALAQLDHEAELFALLESRCQQTRPEVLREEDEEEDEEEVSSISNNRRYNAWAHSSSPPPTAAPVASAPRFYVAPVYTQPASYQRQPQAQAQRHQVELQERPHSTSSNSSQTQPAPTPIPLADFFASHHPQQSRPAAQTNHDDNEPPPDSFFMQ